MTTYPLHIAFGSYTVVGLTVFILAASMAGYLLRLPSKSQATQSLLTFFIMVALSGANMILANAFLYWDRLFVPWQDFWVIAGSIALARFAYRFPHVERSLEARVVLAVMSFSTFLALGYCLVFDYRFLFNWTPGLDVNDTFYLLLPITTLLIVIIFLRHSVHFSSQGVTNTNRSGLKKIGYHLIHPQNEDARVFRSLALALSFAFLPGLQTLFHFPGYYGVILSNIGSILAIITIALVYFNYAPDVNSFMAKLVGVTLATVLVLIAIFGVLDIYNTQQLQYPKARRQALAFVHETLMNTREIIAYPGIAYVVSWEAASPEDEKAYQELYRAENEVSFNLDTLIKENGEGYLETSMQPITDPPPQFRDADLGYIWHGGIYPAGSGAEDYFGYIFTVGPRAYEIGFSWVAMRDDLSAVILKWLMFILVSSFFVLVIFPLFFRRMLVEPLENLLGGVRRVNQGDLETPIPVRFNDEIGFLTQSFNRMVSSLNQATFELQNRALALEAEVNQRTIDLIQANVKLEKENVEREKAELQLNQQLLYQQALAGCSQSLLVMAEDENSQQEVLNQALEHLLSGAQASRAYVFRIFEDDELGLCMGMLAEVCAPGVPAHIHNPENQKFPVSRFPKGFAEELSKGNPFGGLVKEVFASKPELKEALLTQKQPLLSVMFFPLFMREQVWGFIGFDECSTERAWEEMEISMLRTASEMIGNTLQRWEIETQLRETLDELENRVYRRTEALSQSVARLNEEIQQRQLVQNDLETRLQIEEILAGISVRLLKTTGIRDKISASLAELAQMMNAGRIFLAEFDLRTSNQVRDYIEWHRPDVPPMSEDIVQDFMDSLIGLRDRLRNDETIYIQDTAQPPDHLEIDMGPLQAHQVQSLVLLPIIIDQRVQGVLGCSNLQASSEQVQMNLLALELVTGMFQSLWQREYLIQTLEEQIAERTRQLTTFLDMAMLGDQDQDLPDLLQPTLLSITQIAGCDAAGIHIINEKNASLELIAQRGIPSEFLQSLREIELDAEFAAWLEETDPYEFLGDLARGPVFPEPFCFPGFHAFYANRLGTGSKSLGLLSCYRFEDQPFSPFQATLLTALGELLGIIVENFRLRSEAEELAVIEERQHLAREIHDAVSQSVYSLSLFARSANDALDDGNQDKLSANLQDIEATALQAMREMRLLLYQLREVGRGEDIIVALENRFKQVENRLGIQATCEANTEIWLPVDIRHQVWRVLIEALNNTVKHAEATQVQVQFNCLDEYLEVTVQDDGIGFDVEHPSPGMGLYNMRARAEIINGQLDIMSEAGQGTRISLNIPIACLEPEEGDEPWQRR